MDHILSITGKEICETLRRGRKVFLVDAGEEEQLESELVPDAISLPVDQIYEQQMPWDRDAEIVVCAGSLGDRVTTTLEFFEMGYTNVRYFIGDLNQLVEMVRENESEPLGIVAA